MKKMFKKIYVEITNICNLNCGFCAKNGRSREMMSREKFLEILDKIEDYTDYIYLHVLGEPLIHKDIEYFIEEASKRFNINITTNGYLIDKIKDCKDIRQVNVSLHSFDVNKGFSLANYLGKVVLCCDNLSKNNTYINYRLWVKNDNYEEVIKYLEDYYDVDIRLDKGSFKIRDNIYLSIEKEFIWPDMENEYYNDRGVCEGTISQIGILVDGTVIPCCLDCEGKINLGNIFESDMKDIVDSIRFKKIREGFKRGYKEEELCRHCSFLKHK